MSWYIKANYPQWERVKTLLHKKRREACSLPSFIIKGSLARSARSARLASAPPSLRRPPLLRRGIAHKCGRLPLPQTSLRSLARLALLRPLRRPRCVVGRTRRPPALLRRGACVPPSLPRLPYEVDTKNTFCAIRPAPALVALALGEL